MCVGSCVCVPVRIVAISYVSMYVSLLHVLHSLDKFYWSFQLGITGSGTGYKKLESLSHVRLSYSFYVVLCVVYN